MLEPEQRLLFLETLRPPEGYRFDRAVGTTFTLDLMALLAVPLAFTFRDAHDGDDRLAEDPLALLESARQHAGNIILFCHGGHTAVPKEGVTALAFLEQSVVTAFPPQANGDWATFHPKLWVLRYTAEDGSVRYRLVCQSRNLTFDKSWDTTLALDGELDQERTRGFGVNRPLADFIRNLPDLAARPVSKEQRGIVERVANELRRVRFRGPDGLQVSRFLPLGVGRRNQAFPALDRRPLLVMSPFLDDEYLRSIASGRRRAVLVSRRDELLRASAEAIGAFHEVYAFREGLEPEPEDTDAEIGQLSGLHAKVYVVDDGRNAHVTVGSANATGAAMGDPPRNVEFMVELTGRKNGFGIDALLKPGKDGDAGTFRSLIEPFCKSEEGTLDGEDDARILERLLDRAVTTLVRAELKGVVEPSEDGAYNLRLVLPKLPNMPPEVSSVSCWPAMLVSERRLPLSNESEFAGLSLPDLSRFLAIEVRVSLNGELAVKRFVRPIQVDGLPEDRLQRLLASMVGDPDRLLRLLWLLLSPDEALVFGEFTRLLSSAHASAVSELALPGLLERMLETLYSSPGRLDSVASLVENLRTTEEGAKLIASDFDAAWEPIWVARGLAR